MPVTAVCRTKEDKVRIGDLFGRRQPRRAPAAGGGDDLGRGRVKEGLPGRRSGQPLSGAGAARLALGLTVAVLVAGPGVQAASAPTVTSVARGESGLMIAVDAPPGYRHAVLEGGAAVVGGLREALVAGGMNGDRAVVTFRVPTPASTTFLWVRLGADPVVPPARHTGADYFSVDYPGGGTFPLTAEEQAGHVLGRLAYGPTPQDLEAVLGQGVAAYLARQLAPETIDESDNTELLRREAALFETRQPSEDTLWIEAGDTWRYLKGIQAPPADWAAVEFLDAAWAQGPSGFGYADDDDATELTDMRQAAGIPGYLTLYLRKTFHVASPQDLDALILRVDYDDGFVAYLNGTEVARANLAGRPPLHNEPATDDHEAGDAEDFDLTSQSGLLRAGANVLAIQVHNVSLTSSDLSMIPELLARRFLPIPAQRRIRGIEALQQLVHVRGVYSRRHLQTVLAEFWDNHFTTDFDKVAEYFADLENSDARTAMSASQAEAEAAQAEYEEYQFFLDHALGNFGDLLLYSATSPPQLIYLDNVLNIKGAANENYAREILELFAFGVDNRYTQEDIEQLARCFTGWRVRKVWPQERLAFPASARTPPTTESVQTRDDEWLGLGPGWVYFKGQREPTPGPDGEPTLAWARPEFDDRSWAAGSTGIGYGDGDDATVLADMRNGYASVYLRREFTVADPASAGNLVLAVDFDDGFVAYLNGVEVARSRTMEGTGTPPRFNRLSGGGREAGDEAVFALRDHRHLLRPAPERNVLAFQVHNQTLNSSDLSLRPRLVDRRVLPGSIENGDENGVWTFRFDPDRHDTTAKVLFRGTPHEIRVPAGRTGIEGLQDALQVVDTFVRHPSVSEFICLKLIHKLVSDDLSLTSYRDGTAPAALRALMDDAIAAWHSTEPPGNIRTVVQAILRPATLDGYFWSRAAFRSKVKTPIEFINSSVRALQADVSGTGLPGRNDAMGMHLFTRDDPDGWSELGVDWIDTGTLLARIQFAQELAGGRVSGVAWNAAAWAQARQLTSAEAIIEYFNRLLFQGAMAPSNRELLLRFATTDDDDNPLPFDPSRGDFGTRVRELVSLILAMPQWHFQ